MKYEEMNNYKYRLLEEKTFKLPFKTGLTLYTQWFDIDNDIVRAREGYCWDGASGPAIDTKTIMMGSLAHDCFYQAIKLNLIGQKYRKMADEILMYYCSLAYDVKINGKYDKRVKMCKFRRYYVYKAVRLFGDDALRISDEKKNVIEITIAEDDI